jgi:hypothetical protein
MSKNENDIRADVFNSLLTTPHRKLDLVMPLHQEMIQKDPLFYGHLAVWYAENGEIRDHGEAFIATLLTSDMEEHRDAGFVLMNDLEPYRVERVRKAVKTFYKKEPRCMKTAIRKYLRDREANDGWFDGCAVRAKKAMRSLYAGSHIKPSERADAILFKDNPPKGSRPYFVKVLSDAKDSEEQARLIVENGIPYTIAVGAIEEITAPIAIALVNSMSPQEVINNLNSMKKNGTMSMPGVKEIVDDKIKAAAKDKRVSANKATVAAEAAGVDSKMKEELDKVANEQVRSKGVITRNTAILVDKSSSLSEAIEAGKNLAATVSGVMSPDADLFVWAFDSAPFEIKSKGNDMTHWQDAFKGIRASGTTSIGAPIIAMAKKKQMVEQFIIVTDEGENGIPTADAYMKYASDMGVRPDVIILKVGRASSVVESRLDAAGIAYSTMEFNGDYYSLPNIIPMLTKGGQLELLMEIMDNELPVRTDRTDRAQVSA